ncbi:4'-phosphopantetheinyl transferase superfamily protein [Flavobacteriaceae bacterium R38]|nr:4'-phosphopantetheinyl transferase superfamily protein [Flavobacteriaceae bacterium R38]
MDINTDMQTYYFNLLASDEKEKAGKFYFEKDRRKYIAARGILRTLSGRYLNEDPKQVQFTYGEYGKPAYLQHPNLKFNISHSGEIVVLGFVHNYEFGIDVEFIKSNFDVLDIAQNFFSSKEIAALEKLPETLQNHAFFRCWTRKESFIKAKGSGLSFPLDKFTVSIDSDTEATLLETVWDSSEKKEWNVFSFVPAKGYLAALVARGDVRAVTYKNWDTIIS